MLHLFFLSNTIIVNLTWEQISHCQFVPILPNGALEVCVNDLLSNTNTASHVFCAMLWFSWIACHPFHNVSISVVLVFNLSTPFGHLVIGFHLIHFAPIRNAIVMDFSFLEPLLKLELFEKWCL